MSNPLPHSSSAQADVATDNVRFQTLFEMSPVGMALVDHQTGEFLDVNQALLNVVGYGKQEFLALSFWDITPAEYANQEAEQIKELNTQGRFGPNEKEYIRKDGTRFPISISGFLHIDADGRKVVWGIIEDISERKKHEQAILKAKEAAEALAHSKANFLANMSHEIRTPMNAIFGFIQLLERETQNPSQLDKIKKINAASKHLLNVINDILDLSKIEANRLELEEINFCIQELFADVNSIVADRANTKQLHLMETIAPALSGLVLQGDRIRISQILINLLSNAIKFTHQGRINTSAHIETEDENSLRIRFEVADTGIGISNQQQERIFEAFEQAETSTTRHYGGSGLGLTISRRLVNMMGGQMGVDSSPGQGSRFWFTIRLKRAKTLSNGTAEHHPDVSFRPGARILLVEDNEFNQELSCEVLRSAGLVVDIADHGGIALEMFQHTRYDLILMDIHMPVMDGFEATRRIRALEIGRSIPILAMTANVLSEDREQCLEVGMNEFLTKPIEIESFFQALSRWIPEQWVQGAYDDIAHDCNQ